MALNTAVAFGSFVGAQLTALIEAEIEGAEKTSEFIEQVGFEEQEIDGTKRLVLRTVAFEMDRRNTDGTTHRHTVRIPVLNLVPIPVLSIESADIEFDMQVEAVENEAEAAERAPAQPHNARLRAARVREAIAVLPRKRLLTRVSRTRRRNTRTTTHADLRVKIHIAQSAFPLGIERLLEIADLSVADSDHGRVENE